MTSVSHEYDYFWDAAVAAVGGAVQGITGAFGARAERKGAEAVAKTNAAADISKAYYANIMAGEDRAKNVGQTNQALIGSYAQRQASKDDAKKAKEKKYMYIGIAAAVVIGGALIAYLFLNKKPTPAA